MDEHDTEKQNFDHEKSNWNEASDPKFDTNKSLDTLWRYLVNFLHVQTLLDPSNWFYFYFFH